MYVSREHLIVSGGSSIDLIYALRADDHDEVVRTAQAHGSGDDGSHYSSALAHVQQNAVRHTNAVRHVHGLDADLVA